MGQNTETVKCICRSPVLDIICPFEQETLLWISGYKESLDENFQHFNWLEAQSFLIFVYCVLALLCFLKVCVT